MVRSILYGCFAALSLIACSSPGSESSDDVRVNVTEGVEPRIVAGTTSPTTQDSVVYISINNVAASNYCSGTLIAPNLVLTSRRCVSQMNGGNNNSCGTFTNDTNPSNLGIAVGGSANGNSQKIAKGTQIFHEASSNECGDDIALIQLSMDIPGAAVSPIKFAAVAAGATGYTAVGYGLLDSAGDKANARLERSGLTVDHVGAVTYDYMTQGGDSMEVQVAAGEMTTGEATCTGDMGGPLLDSSGAIVGVTSRGIDGNCKDRPTIWSDVVSHQAMIMAAAQTAGHPLTFTTTSGTDAGAPLGDDAGAGVGPSPRTGGSGDDSSGSGGLDDSSGDGSGGDLLDPNQGSQTATTGACSMSLHHAEDAGVGIFGLALAGMLLVRRRRAQ